ncbi:MAG: hypothetical protein LBF78_04385 [Treponema sp.]|jgi:hypothetical protein|nr:hypothetical protein [Treponema sp.]
MPSQILHILFGEDVIDEIYRRIGPRFGIVADKALKKIKKDLDASFALGCQGPDLFYHSQKRRPVGVEYGSLLHRRGAGIFTAGLLNMGLPDPPPSKEDIEAGRREKSINALGVYALGFMTHAILDRKSHPYIVYKAESRHHAFFERIIDALMLKRLRGGDISLYGGQEVLKETCENPPSGLKELLEKALVLAFPERAGNDKKLKARIDNTFADCADFYFLTDPQKAPYSGGKGGAGGSLVSPEMVPYLFPVKISRNIDFLNLEHRSWYSPVSGGAESRLSFPELYSGAVDAAAGAMCPFIVRYLDTGNFPILEAAQAIGNGGLSVVDSQGRPAAAVHRNPLPLDDVLEEQLRLRSGLYIFKTDVS